MAAPRVARAQSVAGTISGASGQVQIHRGGATLAARRDTVVKQGDTIVCGANGLAFMTLTDGSHLALQPSTTVTLDRYTAGGATPTRVSLLSGTVESTVKGNSEAPANYQVHTPNAIVTARGTDFYTAYTESSPELGNLPGVSHYTEVAVIDGTVNLAQAADPHSGVEVAQGTTGVVPGDQPPRHDKRHFPHPPHPPHPHHPPHPEHPEHP